MDENMELKNILEPGESVIWSARPDAWYYARPTFMIYIVGVPWTVFTFFFLKVITGGFQWPGPTAPPIPWWLPWVGIWAGILLLAAGLWMLSAPYWIWLRGKNTIHALTTQRALVVDTRRPQKLQTLDLQGKINFKVTDPDTTISDLDVINEAGKGILFRAMREPRQVVEQLKKNWTE